MSKDSDVLLKGVGALTLMVCSWAAALFGIAAAIRLITGVAILESLIALTICGLYLRWYMVKQDEW